MTALAQRPIGVFDSGLGGLTVVRALRERLPHENILYVGDTARVPYGTKSPETIRRYSLQIASFLLKRRVKMIVVACNTSSALALNVLKSLPIPIVGVIKPGARAAAAQTDSGRVGVIGTPATVASHAYRDAIRKKSPRARVWETACPLFVPLVEEGLHDDSIAEIVARRYLKPVLAHRIDTLVLGCTHYPLLKKTLQRVSGQRIALIDSAEETAHDVETKLKADGAINARRARGSLDCFVTDNAPSFSRLGRQFLGERIKPARRLAWEGL
jgi:glutamate racemase